MQLISKRPNLFISWVLVVMTMVSCLPSQAFAADAAAVRKVVTGCILAMSLAVRSHGQVPDTKPATPPVQTPAAAAPADNSATNPPLANAVDPAKSQIGVPKVLTTKEQDKIAQEKADAEKLQAEGAKKKAEVKAETKTADADTVKPPGPRTESETLLKELETLGVSPERVKEIQKTFNEEFATSMKDWDDANPKTPDEILLDSTAGAVSRSILKWPFLQRQFFVGAVFSLVIGPTMLMLLREKKLGWQRRLDANTEVRQYLQPTSDALDEAMKVAIRSMTGGISAEEKPGLTKRIKDEDALTPEVREAMIAAIEATTAPTEGDIPVLSPDEALEKLRVATDAYLAAVNSAFVAKELKRTGLPALNPLKDWAELEEGAHHTIVQAMLGLDGGKRKVTDQLKDNEIIGTKLLNKNLGPGERNFFGDLMEMSRILDSTFCNTYPELKIDFERLKTISLANLKDNFAWTLAAAKTHSVNTAILVKKLTFYLISSPESKHAINKEMTQLYRRIQARHRLTVAAKWSWDTALRALKSGTKMTATVTTQLPKAVWKLGTRRIATVLIIAAFTGPPAYSLIDQAITTAAAHASANAESARIAELARANNAMLVDSALVTNDEQVLKAVVTAWEGFNDGTDLTAWWTAHFRNRLKLKWKGSTEENRQNLTDIRYLHFKALQKQMEEWNSWKYVRRDYWLGNKFIPALNVEHYKVLFGLVIEEHGFIFGEAETAEAAETKERIIAALAQDAANVLYTKPQNGLDRVIVITAPSGPGPMDGGSLTNDAGVPAAGMPAQPDPNAPPAGTPVPTPPADPNAPPAGTPAPTPAADPNAPPAGTPAPTPPADPNAPPAGTPAPTPAGTPTAPPAEPPKSI